MANLGDRVKDTITGLTGIVVGRYEYLHGCLRIDVQPEETKDGKPLEAYVFDDGQLEVIKAGVFPQSAMSGGPALGDKVKDHITGLVGIVTGRSGYLFFPLHCTVHPQEVKEGKPVGGTNMPAARLEVIAPAVFKPLVQETAGETRIQRWTGGPREDDYVARSPVR